MADFKKIIILRNEVEASYLEAQLNEHNIPFVIRSYHDSAYDGMFQFQKGRGHVESDEAHRQIIESIYQDMLDASGDSNE